MRISDWSSDVCSSDLDIDAAEMSEAARLALFGDIASGMRAQLADILRSLPPGTLPQAGHRALAKGVDKLANPVDDMHTSEADRKSDAYGNRESVREDHGGRREIKIKKKIH